MSDRGLDALIVGLLLILPIAALAGRRVPRGTLAKMALAWLVIFAIGWVVAVSLGYR